VFIGGIKMVTHEQVQMRAVTLAVPVEEEKLEGRLYIAWEGGFQFPRKHQFKPTIVPIGIELLQEAQDRGDRSIIPSEGYQIEAETEDRVIREIVKQINQGYSPELGLWKFQEPFSDNAATHLDNLLSLFSPQLDWVKQAVNNEVLYCFNRLIGLPHTVADPSYREMETHKGTGIPMKPAEGSGHYLPLGVNSKRR